MNPTMNKIYIKILGHKKVKFFTYVRYFYYHKILLPNTMLGYSLA